MPTANGTLGMAGELIERVDVDVLDDLGTNEPSTNDTAGSTVCDNELTAETPPVTL